MTEAHAAAARPIGFFVVVTRIFLLLKAEYPFSGNAAWIASLIGFLIALPLLWLMQHFSRENPEISPREALKGRAAVPLGVASVAIALLLIGNAASSARYMFLSANYVVMGSVGKWAILLPMLFVCLIALRMGGRGVTGAAALALSAIPWLLGIIIVVQVPHYEPAWLVPLLGGGWKSIVGGGVRAAGAYVQILALWLVIVPDERATKRRFSPVTLSALAAAAAAILLLLNAMMSPAGSDAGSLTMRLNTLLYNGRAPLSLHFPVMGVWMLSLIHLMSFSLFTSSRLLAQTMPRIPAGWIQAFTLAATGALSFIGTDPIPSAFIAASALQYPIAGCAALIAFLMVRPERRSHA